MRTCPWILAALAGLGCGGLASSVGADAGTDRGQMSHVDAAMTDARDAVGPSVDARHFTDERVVFLVETSGAMIVLDPGKVRIVAIDQFAADHAGTDELAVIAFDTSVVTLAPFSGHPDEATINSGVSQSNGVSDYETALDVAAELIDNDAKGTPAATLAQRRYVVVLLAGSTPDPQCTAEATPCGSTTCPAKQYCSLGACFEEFPICTTPRADWGTDFSPPVNPALYPGLVAGADYNTTTLVDQKVANILALQSKYKIGSVALDAALVFDPMAAKNPLLATFHLTRDTSAAWLKQLAKAGGGSYFDLSITTKLPL